MVLATLEREMKEAGHNMVTTWSGIEPLRLCAVDSLLVGTIYLIYLLASFWNGFCVCRSGLKY
jgi:hypothetical protein